MRNPISKEDLLEVHRELRSVLNEIDEGLILLQITRGFGRGPRTLPFPDSRHNRAYDRVFTQSKGPVMAEQPAAKKGAKVISIEDTAGAAHIKTAATFCYRRLGKMMAKKRAVTMVEWSRTGLSPNGTEQQRPISSWANKIITRALSNEIFAGITRAGRSAVCKRSADGGGKNATLHHEGAAGG